MQKELLRNSQCITPVIIHYSMPNSRLLAFIMLTLSRSLRLKCTGAPASHHTHFLNYHEKGGIMWHMPSDIPFNSVKGHPNSFLCNQMANPRTGPRQGCACPCVFRAARFKCTGCSKTTSHSPWPYAGRCPRWLHIGGSLESDRHLLLGHSSVPAEENHKGPPGCLS